jgi:NAD dependent epimerase/dehydratase
MNLKGKKILVTGADGFIGSHLTETLVRQGHQVRAFVLYNSFGSWGWLDHAEKNLRDSLDIFMGDIRDPNGVRTAVKNCDVVLHLAALIGIPYSYHSPDTYVDTNIKGTLNILQAARDSGVSKVIQTSTSEVYGTARFVPITEEHPLQGQSPYSATKIGADHIALSFYSSFDTPVTIIRPFNTYGPRQSARAVIPTVITQIANGAKQIKLGALHPTRDFNYIDDTVSGFIAGAEADNALGQVVNIGSSFEISIGDTVKLIAKLMDRDVEIISDEQRLRPAASEVERLFADNSKAQRLLRWSPLFNKV